MRKHRRCEIMHTVMHNVVTTWLLQLLIRINIYSQAFVTIYVENIINQTEKKMKKVFGILLLSGIILFSASCNEKTKNDAEKTYQDAKESVQESAGKASDKIEEGANKAEDALNNTKENVNNNAKEVKKDIEQGVDSLKKKLN